ncbi:hypothetical protein ACO0SA_003146 [Hanseniaspora valbyensis]|uniref:Ras-domain-containing protein n=1 Tax=Hanseniaspora valbyensis NRRL Y-1626 TaxID=766949 RepID=A0A1B7TB57_9ASCO|nr:hypothetical protein HANVADRAFT_53521 [Hanseniaspora valbyensis NRRL Y-1626]
MIQFKLVLLGDSSVGKSSIVTRFVKDQFDLNKESTIGAAFLSQTIKLLDGDSGEEVAIKFEIWDTAGQERYKSLAPMYYRNSNAAIVVYDLCDANSLSKAVKWVNELKEKLGEDNDCIISLIGNKLDITLEDESKRAISFKEGEDFAIENGLYFHEVSAKDNIGIKDIFQEIGESLYKQYKEKRVKNSTANGPGTSGTSNVELNRPSTNDSTSCCS